MHHKYVFQDTSDWMSVRFQVLKCSTFLFELRIPELYPDKCIPLK